MPKAGIGKTNTSSVSAVQGVDKFSHADTEGLGIGRSQLYPTWLLMKTQLLICKRYSTEIGKYKYPAYKMLLSCLQLPEGDKLPFTLMSLGRAKFVRTAVDLLFHSCLVSPLNAEELVYEGGAAVLGKLLDCYVTFVSSLTESDISQNDDLISLQMESLVYVVHTIAGVAYYEHGRKALECLPVSLRFSENWRSCIDLRLIGNNIHGCNLLKRYALEGLMSMAKSAKLQHSLTESGLAWNLIHCMLDYDPTLDLTSLDTEECERTISQEEMNYYGGLAARALGLLCGVMRGEFASPSNEPLFDAVKRVLTKPIAKMLRSINSEETLCTLNLNVETPLRLWDMKMRSELMNFVNQMESRDSVGLQCHLEAANAFKYSNLADEVNIGGVYVRIFNTMDVKEAIREIPDCSHFARSLLQFIGRSIMNDGKDSGAIERSYVESFSEEKTNGATDDPEREKDWCPLEDDRFVMCLQAVLHLVKTDGLVDDVMCEPNAAGVIMSLMCLRYESKVRGFTVIDLC